MTARILENYNQGLILEFSLDMHRARMKVKEPPLHKTCLEPGPISSGLVPNPAPVLPYVPPTNKELEMLFQPMFDEYFFPPGNRQDPLPSVVQDPVIPTGPSVSMSIDLDAPSGSHTSSPLDHHSSSVHHGVAGEQYAEVNPFAAADHEPFVNVFAPDPTTEASSSGEIMMPELNQSTQPHEHIRKWTDSHPLDNIIGNPSRPDIDMQLPPAKMTVINDVETAFLNGELKKTSCHQPDRLLAQFLGDKLVQLVIKDKQLARLSRQQWPKYIGVLVVCPNPMSAIALCATNILQLRSKHIDIRIISSETSGKRKWVELYFVRREYQWRIYSPRRCLEKIRLIIQAWHEVYTKPETLKSLRMIELDELNGFDPLKDATQRRSSGSRSSAEALATIINMCPFGTTSGFEKDQSPSATDPLGGVVNSRLTLLMLRKFQLSGHEVRPTNTDFSHGPDGRYGPIATPYRLPRQPTILPTGKAHNIVGYHERIYGPLRSSSALERRIIVGDNPTVRPNGAMSSYSAQVIHQGLNWESGKKRTAKVLALVISLLMKGFFLLYNPRIESNGAMRFWKKILQERLTDAYPTQRGPLPPVVFRKTNTGKFQPLPEVPGKGKEKVGEEQAAQVLLNLQDSKEKATGLKQYIFQRRSHVPTETASREDSTSLYAELGLYGSDTESDEEMPSVVRSGAQDEGQARPRHIPDVRSIAANGLMNRRPKAEIELVSVTLVQQDSVSLSSLLEVLVTAVIGMQTMEFIDSQEIDRKINESVKEVVISSVKHAMRAPLHARFKDLPTSDMKEILLQRMLEENYDKGHANHRVAYEALQDSIRRDESEDFDVDKAQEETKKKSKQDSPNTLPGSPPSPPPPPPPPSGASGASGTTRASDSAQAPPPPP
ncbi:hypothetical protein Tco_0162200 [Tanacetum coccineum]